MANSIWSPLASSTSINKLQNTQDVHMTHTYNICMAKQFPYTSLSYVFSISIKATNKHSFLTLAISIILSSINRLSSDPLTMTSYIFKVCFRILNGLEKINQESMFIRSRCTNTRCHTMKLEKKHVHLDIRKYLFTKRVIDYLVSCQCRKY